MRVRPVDWHGDPTAAPTLAGLVMTANHSGLLSSDGASHTGHAGRSPITAGAKRLPLIAAAVLIYSTTLLFAYRFEVSPSFSYLGLTYRAPDPIAYTVAVLLTMLVAIILPRRIVRASDFLQWMMFLVAGAPTILLPQYLDELPVGESTRLGLVVAGCMVLTRFGASTKVTLGRLRPAPNLARQAWLVMAAISLGVYGYVFATTGIPTEWVSITDPYDVRSEFTAATTGTIIGYLLPFQSNVINPIAITRGIYTRNWPLFYLGFLGQIVIYLSRGEKGVLFLTFAMLGLAWLLRRDPYLSGARLLMVGVGIIVGALVVDAIFSSLTWTSLLVRRFLIVPGALTVAYVSVFKDMPKTHFHELPFFGDSPYTTIPPSHIVGAEFIGNPAANANVNIWGHGYLSAGYTGMFIAAALFVLALWIADASTEGLPIRVVSVVLLKMTIVLSSASLFAASLTHGFATGLVLLALLPRDGWGTAGREPDTHGSPDKESVP